VVETYKADDKQELLELLSDDTNLTERGRRMLEAILEEDEWRERVETARRRFATGNLESSLEHPDCLEDRRKRRQSSPNG
jgi:hypothetical protein